MEKVFFKNSRGQKLCGILHRAGKEKAVVMAHGFAADKDEAGIFVRTAEVLCREGFTVLRFDFAGSGESEGEFSEMSFSTEAQDLESTIDFMKNKDTIKSAFWGKALAEPFRFLAAPKASKPWLCGILWQGWRASGIT